VGLKVSDSNDVYRASTDELVENFRIALMALLPIADRAKINYGDADTHRDWERLAECCFDTFVRSPINADRAATQRELPIARYDVDLADYLGASWLTPFPDDPYRGAFVRLLSINAPFDTLQVVSVDPRSLLAGERMILPLSGAKIALFRRTETGDATVVSMIDAVE
jgi:hypothetical protein